MSITSTPHRRLLALLVAVSIGCAACGTGETIDVGSPADESNAESTDTTASNLPEPESGDETMPDVPRDVTDGFTPLIPRTDLIQLVPSQPEITVDPTDDSRLLIHFEGAAEPCSGASVSVTETAADVEILFQTGLDPNVAAMSCIAQVFNYEIVVQLDAPLGDRSIGAAT